MNILILGDAANFEECQQKFGKGHSYTHKVNRQAAEKLVDQTDVIFDFTIEANGEQLEIYKSYPEAVVFFNTCTVNLATLATTLNKNLTCKFFGFAGMPTFLNREILETTLYNEVDKPKLKEICAKLNTSFQIVEDRVGLVTPRVICMIINEAYYTLEEGTATREDIDLAMKLGTNYPFGPFEWSKRIGLRCVYDLLEAVYKDTKDERYRICAKLKEECKVATL
jgi:3-hydroxybutyryl-CoA dehydrogenase